jgi:hypothetical protein
MVNFEEYPREYALQLVEEGTVTSHHVLCCALKYMSYDDVQDMLDSNELSPRFLPRLRKVFQYDYIEY